MARISFLLWLLFSIEALGAVLPQDEQPQNLAAQVSILRDDPGFATLANVRRSPKSEAFAGLSGRSINHGFTRSAFWYRVPLENTADSRWRGVLEIDFAALDEIDFNLVRADGTVETRLGGDVRPPGSTGFLHRNPAFEIELAAGERAEVFLRVATDGPHGFSMLLWNDRAFEAKTARENLTFGMLYGVMLVMVIYNLLTFLVLRDLAYLYYLSFVASFGLILANLDGYLIPLLWAVTPAAVNLFIPLMVAAAAMSAQLFLCRSLDTATIAPRLHRLLVTMGWLTGACLLVPFFTSVLVSIFVNTLVALLTTAALALVILRLAYEGRRTAQFYVAVWALLAIGVVAKVLELNGLLPVSVWTTYAMHLGACFLVTLVSLGLADQINAMRREHLRLEGERVMAQAAAKSEFLAKMSHELRTPMNAIIGFTDLALRSPDDTRRVEHLGHIDTAARSLLHILNDVLDLTEIESGKLVLEARTFDLQPLLDKVAGLVAREADRRGLDVIVARAPDVPVRLVGDAPRLEQVLLHLLGNAVKFTENGEVELRVDLESQEEERAQVRFSVRDTGIGVAPEVLPQLFTPFSQGDQTMTRKYGGTGLGLAVCRQLVERMGGHIEVRSDPGMGSEFQFTLALGVGPEAAAETMSLSGSRVLVAARNGSLRRMYAEILLRWRVKEDTTDSAAGLLALLRKSRFDAVLLDSNLQDGPGLDALRRIRADPALAACPVVFLCGQEQEGVIRDAIAAGASACLTKPVKPSLLAETLEEFLREGAQPRGRARPEVAGTAAAQQLRGARVLLVEDNAINRRLACEILDEAGVIVDTAEDGLQAVEAVQAQRYDAVLMDLQMPVMDGFAATRAIRALPGYGALPVLAMTANAMQQDRDQAAAGGLNDFLPKPIDADQLLEMLARWVAPRDNSVLG